MSRVILIVDDEADIRESLSAFIETAIPDVEVKTAVSGEEGLRRLHEGPVDVILSDYKMPGMNGVEFLAAARDASPKTPRLMFTAFATPQLAAEATHDAGVIMVISKPFDLDYFVDLMRSILTHRRTPDGSMRRP